MKNSYKLGMKIGYFGYDKGALIPVVYLDWFKRYQEDMRECKHTARNGDQTAIIPYVYSYEKVINLGMKDGYFGSDKWL